MNNYILTWLIVSGVVAFCAFICWFACFMTAMGFLAKTHYRRDEMRKAKRCLIAILLSWSWPVVFPAFMAHLFIKTFREAK